MFNRSHYIVSALIVAVAIAGSARADDEDRQRPDVEIDSLKASMRYYDGSWHVSVKYEVEVEGGVPSDLRLVLYFTDRGRTVADPSGEPFEFVLPLERPSEIDDDELEFEETIVLELPDRSFSDSRRLKLKAVAVYGPEGRTLDRKDRTVKLKTASWRHGHHRVSIHYRYSHR